MTAHLTLNLPASFVIPNERSDDPGSSLRSVKPRTARHANHLKALKAGSRALVKNKPRDDDGLAYEGLGFARFIPLVIPALVAGTQTYLAKTAK